MRFLLSLATTLVAVLMISTPAQAQNTATFVRYAAPDGEYSLLLPEAPAVKTIRADDKNVPYIDPSAATNTLGEAATYTRTDTRNGDTFSLHMTTLKTDKAFLDGLSDARITSVLEAEFADLTLDKKTVSFSKGSQTLNWGVLTGYSTDNEKRLIFHAAHYLTGLNSITVIRISFALENAAFKDLYAAINPSISYIGG